MTKDERIKQINDSKHYRSPFNTPEILAKASETDLAALETFIAAEAAKETPAPEAPAAVVPPVVAAPVVTETRVAAAAPAPVTAEQWLATAPSEIRDLVERQKASDLATRTRLVAQLKVAQKEYTDAELTAMPIRDLERLSNVAKIAPEVDYGGLGFPRAASGQATTDDAFMNPPDGYALALAAGKK